MQHIAWRTLCVWGVRLIILSALGTLNTSYKKKKKKKKKQLAKAKVHKQKNVFKTWAFYSSVESYSLMKLIKTRPEKLLAKAKAHKQKNGFKTWAFYSSVESYSLMKLIKTRLRNCWLRPKHTNRKMDSRPGPSTPL